tara:strand:- start:3202 stop:4431 length:1230 start_codon:yes stop_codon:yes gene_type:complete
MGFKTTSEIKLKIYTKKKPRHYKVGANNEITISDYGKIKLNSNEQISFIANNGLYDFCRKEWGFYSTPSINKRLKNNKFEIYLVKNIYDNIYLWTVEKNKKNLFLEYLHKENHEIIIRLDEIMSEKDLLNSLKLSFNNLRYGCNGLNKCKNVKKNISTIFTYTCRPKEEPDYKIKNYNRKIVQCKECKHFFAVHKINTSTLYKKNYSHISHGKNLMIKFKKIINLKDNSDNFYRINRILSFFKKLKNKRINLLDVGSGLGIFLYVLKKRVNWKLSGIEPDLNFYNFSKKDLSLKIYNNTFNKKKFNEKFDIITLNKVIEHVKDPDQFLKEISKLLKKNGYVYIEVPDGVAARESKENKNREEFYLDHLHIFSLRSLKNCLVKNKFNLLNIQSIQEKSGKYTIFAFAQLK